jgi:trehalose-6-phosphate synthase
VAVSFLVDNPSLNDVHEFEAYVHILLRDTRGIESRLQAIEWMLGKYHQVAREITVAELGAH